MRDFPPETEGDPVYIYCLSETAEDGAAHSRQDHWRRSRSHVLQRRSRSFEVGSALVYLFYRGLVIPCTDIVACVAEIPQHPAQSQGKQKLKTGIWRMLYWQARRGVKRVGQTRTHSWRHIHVYTSKSLQSLISGSLFMHTLLTWMQICISIILILL